MNQKGYYTAVFSIIVLALVASYVLYPSYKEESLMYFYDRRYEVAYERFSKLYEEGDRSASVAIPLVWLDLRFAQGDHAAKVLEDYVAEHPNDIGAKEYLGEILMDISRPHRYLSISREIYGIKPPKEEMDYDEKLHLHLGEFKGQEGLLREMVKDGTGSQEQYVEYAYLLASEGKMDQAVNVLQKLVKDKPLQEIGQDTMVFITRVLLDFGDKDQARALAVEYLKHFSKFKTTLALIGLFDSRGDDQFVMDLIDLLPVTLQNHPVIVMNRAKQLMDLGRSDLAYQFVVKQFGDDPPDDVEREFFLLALEQEKNEDKLREVAKKIDFSTFERNELYRLVKLLVSKQYHVLSQEISHAIPADRIGSTPALGFAFELAQRPACEDEKECIDDFEKSEDLSDSDRAFLAGIYKLKGYEKQAQEELLELKSLENIHGDQLFEVAKLYVDLELSDEGLDLVEDLREKHPSKETEVDEAWVILAAEEGQVEEVMEFLDQDDTLEQFALEDLFYTSVEKEYNKLAYTIAVELNEDEETPERKEMLALALILNNRVDEGMKLFEQVRKGQFGISDNYFYALTIAAKKDKKYRDILKEHITKKLERGGLNQEETRNYAFILLDNEMKSDAASLFFQLAQDKSYANGDVQTLLYAWGKHLSDDQMEWVIDRAKKSEGKEKGGWLEQLVYVGNPQIVEELTTPSELGFDEIADAYLAAATTMNNKRMITSAVTSLYPKEQRLPRLRVLGDIARNNGLSDAAKEIYLRILEQDPNDSKALEAMGGIYFDEGDYCIAKKYFEKFLMCTEKDNYQVNYFLGEIFWEENKKKLAKRYYDRALYLICTDNAEKPVLAKQEPTDEEIETYESKLTDYENRQQSKLSTKAQIYHRLKKPYLAIGIYQQLLKEYPDKLGHRIAFANLMMDLTRYRSAERLLCIGELFNLSSEKDADHDDSLKTDFCLARARLMRETNHVARSLGILRGECSEDTEDARVDASIADSNFVAGHWHRSMQFINRALDKQPLNHFYRKARKQIVWEHLPAFNFNYEFRKTGIDQREHFFRYHAFTHLTPFLAVESRADFDNIQLSDLTSVKDGVTAPFRGVRKRGELSLISSNWCGDVRKGTLYYAEGIFGGGIEWKRFSYKDIYTFGFDWQRPDWEDIQSTIERGARDEIYAEWFHRYNRSWEVNVGFGGNRYNLWHFSTAAITWQVEGLLTYRVPHRACLHRLLGEEAELTVNYQLDKEQIEYLKKKIGDNGEEFTPLPLTNRENHTLFVFLSKVLHKSLSTEGYFGYLYDRVTGGRLHPVGGVAVILWQWQQTQARFDYNHSASTENTANTVDSFMFNMRHIF